MNAISHQIQLLRRPTGLPTLEDFALRDVPLPALQEGEVQVANQWLSVDPYMRGRMSEAKSYVPPFPLNGPLDRRRGIGGGCVVDLDEADETAGPGLGEAPEIGVDHRRDLRIAAGGVGVGELDDGFARGRHLNDSGQKSVGTKLHGRRQAEGRPRKPISGTVAVMGNSPGRAPEPLPHFGRKEVVVASADDAQRQGARVILACGGRIDDLRRNETESPLAPRAAGQGAQDIAGAQGAAVETAESAAQMRAAGPQNERCIDAAGEGEIGARADARRGESQGLSGARRGRPPWGNRGRVEARLRVGAGQREGRIVQKADDEGECLDFDRSRVVEIAEQGVGRHQRDRIHRARAADAMMTRAEPAEVLDGVERRRRDDLDHGSILSTLNRIWSPGDRRQGGEAAASNISTPVQPMAFQPLGPVFTETPACMPPIVTVPFSMRRDGTVLRGMKMRRSSPCR